MLTFSTKPFWIFLRKAIHLKGHGQIQNSPGGDLITIFTNSRKYKQRTSKKHLKQRSSPKFQDSLAQSERKTSYLKSEEQKNKQRHVFNKKIHGTSGDHVCITGRITT